MATDDDFKVYIDGKWHRAMTLQPGLPAPSGWTLSGSHPSGPVYAEDVPCDPPTGGIWDDLLKGS